MRDCCYINLKQLTTGSLSCKSNNCLHYRETCSQTRNILYIDTYLTRYRYTYCWPAQLAYQCLLSSIISPLYPLHTPFIPWLIVLCSLLCAQCAVASVAVRFNCSRAVPLSSGYKANDKQWQRILAVQELPLPP